MQVITPNHWQLIEAHGSLPVLHPTHATFHDPKLPADILWTSSRQRKQRGVEVVPANGTVARRWPRFWGGTRGSDYRNVSW